MNPPLLSRPLISLALLVASGLGPALPRAANAHPDHHQPTQHGDHHGNSSDQQQHTQHQHTHKHH
jgi:Spy/CpxP family protein refolding chaperone